MDDRLLENSNLDINNNINTLEEESGNILLTSRLNHSCSINSLNNHNNPFLSLSNRIEPVRNIRNPFTTISNHENRQARNLINEIPEIPAFRNAFSRSRIAWDNSTDELILNETRTRRRRIAHNPEEAIDLRSISRIDDFNYLNESFFFDNNFENILEFKFLSDKNGKMIKKALIKLQDKNLIKENHTRDSYNVFVSSFFYLDEKVPLKIFDFIKCLPSISKISKLISSKAFNDVKVYNNLLFLKICLDFYELYYKKYEQSAKIVNKLI